MKYDICIIGGCGHVGLPLGLAFANRQKKVVLYDINKNSVDLVNRKTMPFLDKGTPEALVQAADNGLIVATSERSVISQAENIILVIGTPVDEHLNPRVGDIMEAAKEMADFLTPDHLVVLRSTIYPGITRKVHEYLKEKKGFAAVAFCPERVAEGHGMEEIARLPQIVSACDPQTVKRAKDLFSVLGAEIIEVTPEEAELAKLFSNSWRYISFAIANQFFMIAESQGLDFYKIYKAMVQNYPRLQGFPRAGFTAGPCLLKDTLQLSVFSKNIFFLGHSAMLVNEGLPSFVVEQLKVNVLLKEKVVGILGMTFKADNDDPRDSLSYKLKKILEIEAKKVLCSDPFYSEPGFVKTEELIRSSDIIILGTPHSQYRNLDLNGKEVVDVWNFFPNRPEKI